MQVKNDQPKKELSLVHLDCLRQTEQWKNRIGYNPRGKWKQEVPCYCGVCKNHFQDDEMTYWLFKDQPDNNK